MQNLQPAGPDGFFDTAVGVTQLVTPWLPLAGIIAGGIILGIFNAHNRSKGNSENRAPDVNEAWVEARLARHESDVEHRLRIRIQNFAWELRTVYRAYVTRVQSGGSTDLTNHEKLFYESEPPSEDTPPKSQ